MAKSKSQPITFVIPGVEQSETARSTRGATAISAPLDLSQGWVKQSVLVGASRGGGAVQLTAIPGEDVVVLEIANGPTLTLHPENARDLILAQSGDRRRVDSRGQFAPAPDQTTVPLELRWEGLEQARSARSGTLDGLGRVLLKAVHLVTGVGEGGLADLTALEIVKRFDAQVNPGVYQLEPLLLSKLKESGRRLDRMPASGADQPILVLIHGTFSNTFGTFGKLWTQHPERVKALFDYYGGRVYALDHATLGVSPIANALALALALPKGARVHLLTHSRGGLVAEVLARVCARPDLTPDDFAPFKDADYQAQRDDLRALAQLAKKNDLQVKRMVRVACPARGTLLASKRLDAYLSVFKWALELAHVPVAPELLGFLGEVAKRRTSPEEIPGVAAQLPDSPLVQWLHSVEAPIAGDLRVVAGDIQGDSVVSWLKTLLSDAFFWTDNDLVVQTRSMYGGAPRAAGAAFVLDQSGGASHFNYFSNDITSDAIVKGLTDEAPSGFRVIGPLSWTGESSTGTRAARRSAVDDKSANQKPAVFILPGILGSNLKVDGKRIWLGWRLINGFSRLEYAPSRPNTVEPDGPIDRVYDDLGDFLAKSHEVIEFGYDWRLPIEEEARRLAAAVEKAMDTRTATGQPVRLLAHSMGGLLARTMELEQPATWQRMIAHPDARLLMLGTPNAGSWAPMQVLSADDTFGNALVAFGAPFKDREARAVMANFPGFIQLQAGLLDGKLDRSETWQSLADEDLRRLRERSWWHRLEIQLAAHAWGVPPQSVLDAAVKLRRRFDEQATRGLEAGKGAVVLVAGKARFTPDGYQLGDDGLVYLDAQDYGDGRVTLASAQLPAIRTWQLDCPHGDLPNKKEGFEAFLDLLKTGTTDRLPGVPSALRGMSVAVAHVPSRPSRSRVPSGLPGDERDVLRTVDEATTEIVAAPQSALNITVHNGDLSFVREPLILGHYRSIRLTGTERVMNTLVGEALEHSMRAGLYPEQPGTHQIFVNVRVREGDPERLPRPEAVVVVGLGSEGKLRPSELSQTVRQGVIAWAQRVAERPGVMPQMFDLAATLLGSGGSNVSVGQSARLIAQGVREANLLLSAAGWPLVGHLHLIELYLDRATEAWRALQLQAVGAPSNYHVTEQVQVGSGALLRPLDSDYRGADYDFLSATTDESTEGRIEYTLDTRRARSEVRDQSTQASLIRSLVAKASNDKNTDSQFGSTLCRLLIPLTMDSFLSGVTELVIELDSGTAAIPWELLDTEPPNAADRRPWAVRAKLLRRLRTTEFRQQVVDADSAGSVLVIGEPKCDLSIYPRLPGARAEALAVAKCLADGGIDPERVKRLIAEDDSDDSRPDAHAVINAVFERTGIGGAERRWRIVHIAGHGEPPIMSPPPAKPGDPLPQVVNPRGVVLSDGFLGPFEIRSLRVVPELVFVNCCYLGAADAGQLLRRDETQRGGPYDRVSFASGLAEELIKLGVRCVIAAGWAVDDEPAKRFATTFYDSLIRGRRRFMDAVAEAREAAYQKDSSTWAAYQCYGDPDWTFHVDGPDDHRPTREVKDEFVGVASPLGLTLALRTLAVQSEFQGAPLDRQRTKINYLETRFEKVWGGIGHVAEGFGQAWATAGDRTKAMSWYQRAAAANDGTASLKAIEQRANLMARVAWEKVGEAWDRRDQLEAGADERPRGQKTNSGAAKRRDAKTATVVLQAEAKKAMPQIKKALDLLRKIVALESTVERESLIASAYKRQAMIARAAGLDQDEVRALKAMGQHYQAAYDLANVHQPTEVFYPGLNLLAAHLVLNAGAETFSGFESGLLTAVRQSLDRKVKGDHDFWSAAGVPDLMLYQALADRKLAVSLARIIDAYEDLHRRVAAQWRWRSVYDQACFVLPKYAAAASAPERTAVESLMRLLRGFGLGDS